VWQQARPEFRLQGVRLHDQRDMQRFTCQNCKRRLPWRSLLFLELRFNRIELQGLTLGVRRARDGHIYVAAFRSTRRIPTASLPTGCCGRDACMRQGHADLAGRSAQCTAAGSAGRRFHPHQCAPFAPHAIARRAAADVVAAADGRGAAERPQCGQHQDLERKALKRVWAGGLVAGILANWLTLPFPTPQGSAR